MLIALIADTHLPRGPRKLSEECLEHLRAAELILHAGDVSTARVLEELNALGPPVLAVHGNVDEPALVGALPAQLEVEVAGAHLAMTHDAGAAKGRLVRLRKRFPRADAVIFGHSHRPLHVSEGGFQIFNPGSPTERRREPRHTMGLARAEHGTISFEHVVLAA
jgi:putative phosphoesterase